MGTRRSRHNKGRKPLYKHFETETIRHWGEDGVVAPKWIEDAFEDQSWRDRAERPTSPHVRSAERQSDKVIELLPSVKAYLEKRRTEDVRKTANELFPTLAPTPAAASRFIISDDDLTLASGKLHSSENDVLLQLFIERKITKAKFRIGRTWQRFREQATMQPNASIDWSRSTRFAGYQRRGDLSDLQISAMEYRRRFLDGAGPAAYAFADFCLEPDRGVDDLRQLLKIDEKQTIRVMFDLLSQMLRVYVLSEGAAA